MLNQYLYNITCDACDLDHVLFCTKGFAGEYAYWHSQTMHPDLHTNGVSMFDSDRTARALHY